MNSKRFQLTCTAFLFVILLLGPAVPALADGMIIPVPRPGSPIVDVPYLTVKYHRVTITIDNQVATTRVDQVFVNESQQEVEGTYIFPLPEEAAIGEFTMWVDGQKLAGQVLQREEARRIYEEIVRKRRDPALLEYVGRNAFQASIYPIPAGAERRIEIEYSQVLKLDNGLVEYVYPLNTEKFSAKPLEEVSINVTVKSGEAIKAIYSPSHDVDVVRDGDYRATVGYEESGVKPDRDFVLYYSVSPEDVGLNVISYRPDGKGEGFFLLLAAPKVEIDTQSVIAKDVILVLDVSGSMQGQKIEQAKQALNFVLDNLNAEDRFNVIAFSTSTRAFDDGLVPADQRGEARDFVARLEAAGSTDINRALLEALDMVGPERPTILIFLTDGLPTMGETDVNRIIDNAGGAAPDNVRIFPFGVGYDVNTVLVDTIAQNHRGASGYVRPEEAIDEKVSAFYAKVSTPLLSDIAIDWGGIEVDDVYPYPLPDLFAGTQLAVVGRYRDGGKATISLSGQVNDQLQKFVYDGVTFEQEGGKDFIARLWATRKIGVLLQQIRLHGEEKELVDEIVNLSIRYGIITPYTSFLVEETELALSASGRQDLSEQVAVQVTAAPAVGGAAVQRSEAEKALAGAQAMATAEVSAQVVLQAGATDQYGNLVSPVKYVGDKAFIFDKGTWTDTMFEPDRMTPTLVGFGSDDYFALVASRPEWGKFLAVGDHVIVVLDGTAYEVREGEAPPLTVPTVTPVPEITPTVGPAATVQSDRAQAVIRILVDLIRSFTG